jgi:hypothetical protein
VNRLLQAAAFTKSFGGCVCGRALLVETKVGGGAKSVQAGRLDALEVRASDIVPGSPLFIDKANVD